MIQNQYMANEQELQPPKKQPTDYEGGWSCICRRILFAHLIQMAVDAKSALKDHEALEINDIPQIKEEEKIQSVVDEFEKNIQDQLENSETDQISISNLYKGLFYTLKSSFLFVVFLYVINVGTRLGISVLLKVFFDQVIQSVTKGEDLASAYLIGLGSVVLIFVDSIIRHNCFYEGPIFSGRLRSCLIALMFKKICFLSQYTANKEEIGKVTNMLSNDFNLLEIKAPFFFGWITVPFAYLGIIAVLLDRLGPEGLIALGIPLVFFPIQLLVSRFNGKLLEQMNKHKDKRVKITTELIEAIKHVKIYGWEMAFRKIICIIRENQVTELIKLTIGRGFEFGLANSITYIGGFISLYLRNLEEPLTSGTIFSTIELMNFLRIQNLFLSMGFGFIFEMNVVFERFCNIYNIKSIQMIKFQNEKESEEQSYIGLMLKREPKQTELQNGEFQFVNFSAFWKQDRKDPSLTNINLNFKKNKFYGLCGVVGCGKSTLLQTIIKELPYYTGQFRIEGKVSYFQQQPVIFSQTIKENIIFGRDFNSRRYKKVVQICCLLTDFQLFQDGQNTLVGEKGITLSGGQKARVSLARSIYGDADIYIFDDPLSAVDAKVARHIFTNIFMNFLKNKTIVLSTHQIHFLDKCDYIIALDRGTVKGFGKPKQLSNILSYIMEEDKGFEHFSLEDAKEVQQQSEEKEQKNVKELRKQQNVKVTGKTYVNYLMYENKWRFPLTLFLFISTEVILSMWIRLFSSYEAQVENSQDKPFESIQVFWGVQAALILLFSVFTVLKVISLSFSLIISNEKIHQDMIYSLVRSHSYYFDVTPSGILSNKFSNDIGVLDNTLIFNLHQAMQGPIVCLVMVINIFTINPYFIIVGISAIVGLILYYMFMKDLVLESKQLDLKMKSPVFNKLNQAVSGLTQIQIFDRVNKYFDDINQCINQSFRANMVFWFFSRILGVYVSIIVSVALMIGVMIGIAYSVPNNVQLYAVSVTYLIFCLDYLQWCFRQIINTESSMVSAERCFRMVEVAHEKPIETQYDQKIMKEAKKNQNSTMEQLENIESVSFKGSIHLKDFRMKYREQLPLVLKGIDLEIEAGEKVGIIGRTGAGKSSIIQSLLRICEPDDGSVYQIDEYDALQLGLHTIRRNISVIPQVPFLFRDTIRMNLDPFSDFNDEKVWNALEQSNLSEFVQQLPEKLDTLVSNNSDTFSVGQKQLLCLARSLLRENKIVILDEATSNVDKVTDRFIQKVLREKLKDQTIITIAHRLLTIADYDKVIVMEKGLIKEVGHPYELYTKKGLFYEMTNYTGKGADQIVELAKQSYSKKN